MFQEKRGEGHLARINQKVLTYLSLIKKKRKRNKEFCLCNNAGWAEPQNDSSRINQS